MKTRLSRMQAGLCLAVLLAWIALKTGAQGGQPQGTVVAWGSTSPPPPGLSGVTAVAAGFSGNLALKSDGTVVFWGTGDPVPSGLDGVSAIAFGWGHILALKSNHTVVAWGGRNLGGELNVPSGLVDVVAIAAGGSHSLALRSNGTVVAWGWNSRGQITVPSGLNGVRAVAAGQDHSLACRSNGTVVAWGDNIDGQSTVPPGLTNVVAVAAGAWHSFALKADGTLVAWGYNSSGQSTVPKDLKGVVAMDGGYEHSLALKADGTLVVWGNNYYGQTTVDRSMGGVIAISSGWWHSLAVLSEIPNVSAPLSQTAESGSPVTFSVHGGGSPRLFYQWFFNATNAIGSPTTNSDLHLTDVQPGHAGVYSVVLTNPFAGVTSAPAMLGVTPPVERRSVPAVRLDGQAGPLWRVDYADGLTPQPAWANLGMVLMASTSEHCFDLSTALPVRRFYRAIQSGVSNSALAVRLTFVPSIPAITVTGSPGSQVRVDAINAIGPTDAWFTLGTITLTNTSQLYFDTTALGQPVRLYRLVPLL